MEVKIIAGSLFVHCKIAYFYSVTAEKWLIVSLPNFVMIRRTHFSTGLAGFFPLVEETGLNPGLNRPGRNRFLPPEVEETGQNWKKAWNAWLSEYFPLHEAVILNTYETTAKNVLDTNTLLLFTCSFHGKWNKKLWWLPGRNKFFPLEVSFPLWARGPQRLGWGTELTHTATGEW